MKLMQGPSLVAAAVCAVLLMTAQASAQGLTCSAPLQPMLEIELLFGRNIDGDLGVSEEQWTEFLASEITPRFPQGLSVDDAVGQWRDVETKAIVKEPSKEVTLIVPAGAESELKASLEAIVTAYKQRFRQQSVGIVIKACVSF